VPAAASAASAPATQSGSAPPRYDQNLSLVRRTIASGGLVRLQQRRARVAVSGLASASLAVAPVQAALLHQDEQQEHRLLAPHVCHVSNVMPALWQPPNHPLPPKRSCCCCTLCEVYTVAVTLPASARVL